MRNTIGEEGNGQPPRIIHFPEKISEPYLVLGDPGIKYAETGL